MDILTLFQKKSLDPDFADLDWPDSLHIPPQPRLWTKVPFLRDFLFALKVSWALRAHRDEYRHDSPYNGYAFADASFREVRNCLIAGATLEFTGMAHIRAMAGRPMVVVANHMSLLETFLLPVFFLPHNKVTFVIKESLLHYPYLGHILANIGSIPVGRSNPRDDLRIILEEGRERLARNQFVIIFPQSTRSPNFDLNIFNTIGVKLAQKANVPIMPLALRTDFLSPGKISKDFGRIRPERIIRFAAGEAFECTNARKAQTRCTDFIRSYCLQWGIPVVEKTAVSAES